MRKGTDDSAWLAHSVVQCSGCSEGGWHRSSEGRPQARYPGCPRPCGGGRPGLLGKLGWRERGCGGRRQRRPAWTQRRTQGDPATARTVGRVEKPCAARHRILLAQTGHFPIPRRRLEESGPWPGYGCNPVRFPGGLDDLRRLDGCLSRVVRDIAVKVRTCSASAGSGARGTRRRRPSSIQPRTRQLRIRAEARLRPSAKAIETWAKAKLRRGSRPAPHRRLSSCGAGTARNRNRFRRHLLAPESGPMGSGGVLTKAGRLEAQTPPCRIMSKRPVPSAGRSLQWT
jgi:hypothetical protein